MRLTIAHHVADVIYVGRDHHSKRQLPVRGETVTLIGPQRFNVAKQAIRRQQPTKFGNQFGCTQWVKRKFLSAQ